MARLRRLLPTANVSLVVAAKPEVLFVEEESLQDIIGRLRSSLRNVSVSENTLTLLVKNPLKVTGHILTGIKCRPYLREKPTSTQVQ